MLRSASSLPLPELVVFVSVGATTDRNPSRPRRLATAARSARAHPAVDLAGLELPETSDLVSGHGLLGDPGVDGVFGDSEMGGDVISGQPRLGHVGPPLLYGPRRPTLTMIPVEVRIKSGLSGCSPGWQPL